MKYRILLVLAIVFLLGVTAMAQEGGEGGTIIYGETSGPTNLNPLISSDAYSSDIYGRYFPQLMSASAVTGNIELGYPGTLATGYEFNEDGTVLTVTLREDAVWSDGTPITSQDWLWGAEALRSGLLETSRSTEMFEVLDNGTPGTGPVTDIAALDDYTIQVTFNKVSCTNLIDFTWTILPSHIFDADFGDDLAAMNEEPFYDPGVYFGAWQEPVLVAGDRTSLLGNDGFPDAQMGEVLPESLVILELPDSDIQTERFLAGEITLEDQVDPNYWDQVLESDQFETFFYQRLGYFFMIFNHADPENPQSAYDEDGNFVEQDPHPILGDVRVRQAIAYAANIDALIENALDGQAVRVGIPSIPQRFDWNPDLLYPFDPAVAADLLSEAGWEDTDGDGVRECVSCSYLEIDPAYEGTPMSLSSLVSDSYPALYVDAYNALGENFSDVGIEFNVEFVDFGSVLIPAFYGQNFDMVTLAWSMGLPLDPNSSRDIFGSAADVVDAGFNVGSFHNERVNELYELANDPTQTDGCAIEGRKPFYDEINQIYFDELPYLFMYSNFRMAAIQSNVGNWDPAEFSRSWQEDAWDIDN